MGRRLHRSLIALSLCATLLLLTCAVAASANDNRLMVFAACSRQLAQTVVSDQFNEPSPGDRRGQASSLLLVVHVSDDVGDSVGQT